MVNIDSLYDYPITISDKDFEEITGISLKNELDIETEQEIKDWLNSAHESVYNEIYKIGGPEFKNRLILNNIESSKKTIIKCICVQLKYMLDANGDYGSYDGSNTNADGQLTIVSTEQIRSKILAPKVIEILRSSRPNLLIGA